MLVCPGPMAIRPGRSAASAASVPVTGNGMTTIVFGLPLAEPPLPLPPRAWPLISNGPPATPLTVPPLAPIVAVTLRR